MARTRVKQVCACGAKTKNIDHPAHINGGTHQKWLQIQPVAETNGVVAAQTVVQPALASTVADEPEPEAVDPDIQSVLDIMKTGQADPKVRHIIVARELRKLFSARWWPNAEQPLSVGQMLQKHNIPIQPPARSYAVQGDPGVAPERIANAPVPDKIVGMTGLAR